MVGIIPGKVAVGFEAQYRVVAGKEELLPVTHGVGRVCGLQRLYKRKALISPLIYLSLLTGRVLALYSKCCLGAFRCLLKDAAGINTGFTR